MKDTRTDEEKDEDMYDLYDIYGYIVKSNRVVINPILDGEPKSKKYTQKDDG